MVPTVFFILFTASGCRLCSFLNETRFIFVLFSHPERTGASGLITGWSQGTFMRISQRGNASKLLLIIWDTFNYTGISLTFGRTHFPKCSVSPQAAVVSVQEVRIRVT